jgi:hypothetical protein
MSQQELLKKLLAMLNGHKCPYMLTGSIVSSILGEPRLSHDIDIIIDADKKIEQLLLEQFDTENYYLDEYAIRDAIATQGMFNLIDINSGDKIDFWILTDSAFDASRFARRQSVKLFGEIAWISTPEDTMLSKMLWAKKCGGSEKQLTDVRQVYQYNSASIDRDYMERWCILLGIKHYWDEVRFNETEQ